MKKRNRCFLIMILYKLHFFLCEFSVKRRYANGRHTSKKKVIFIKKVTLTLLDRYKIPSFASFAFLFICYVYFLYGFNKIP